MVQDFFDRQNRRSNVIVLGIKQQGQMSTNDRSNAEKPDTVKVLTHLNLDSVNVPSIHRMGKIDLNKTTPRPIKVTFGSYEQVMNIIKKLKRFKTVSTTFDKSPRQLEY